MIKRQLLRTVSLVFVLVMALSFTTVFATATNSSLGQNTNDEQSWIYALTEESIEAEEFEWRFRYHPDNGRLQKRLWSITYGYWATDWTYCD